MADLEGALRGVEGGMLTLAHSIEVNMSDERIAQIVAEAKLRERRSGQIRMGAVLIIVLVVVGAAFLQSRSNGDQLDKTTLVANYVTNCLQHPSPDPAVRVRQCGPSASGSPAAVLALIEFQKCIAPQPIPQRSAAFLDACQARAVKVLKAPVPG